MKLLEFLAECEATAVPMEERERAAWEKYGDNIAIMVVDSVGFSRTTKSHGIVHFLSKMAAAREAMRGILECSGANSYSYHADNCIAYFSSPDKALDTAIALQKAILTSGIALNEEELYGLSIGIGYGQVLYAESMEGYFGDEMNLASKLGEDIGSRDDILLTQAAYASLEEIDAYSFQELRESVSGVDLKFYSVGWRA